MKTEKIIILFVAYFSLTTAYSQTAREYFDMGDLKANLEDYIGTIADYTKAIEIDSSYAYAYYN